MSIFRSRSRFSKGDILRLFLVCAFPINLWAFIVWLRTISSVADNVTLWDSLGLGGYILGFAFAESLFVFLLVLPIILLLPKHWEQEKTHTQVSVLYLILSAGAILIQSRTMVTFPQDTDLWKAINQINKWVSSSPMIIIIIGAVTLTGMFVWMHRSRKVLGVTIRIIDRLVVLSGLYVILDLLGMLILLIRVL